MFYGEHGYGPYAVRQFLDLFGASVFVAEADGKVVGYAVLGLEGLSKRSWLLAIAVDGAVQKQGAGAALMQRCLSFCEDNGIERCALTVDPDNAPAIALYAKMGFSKAAGPLDYYGDGHSRIVMEKHWG